MDFSRGDVGGLPGQSDLDLASCSVTHIQPLTRFELESAGDNQSYGPKSYYFFLTPAFGFSPRPEKNRSEMSIFFPVHSRNIPTSTR